MNNITQIGEIIRYHRKRAGLTQMQLANLANVGKTSVFDIEKGKSSIRLNTLLAVATVLNITLEPTSPLMGEWDEGTWRGGAANKLEHPTSNIERPTSNKW